MKHYIATDPKIMGGVTRITGTRIPISVILYRLKDGHSIEDINDMYPWVDRNTLEGAIDEAIRHFTTTAHA